MIVEPSGPLDAKIALIGEAPGAEEEIQGEPFVGGAGRLLTAACAAATLPRYACFIDNVSDRRPPGNDFQVFYTSGGPSPELLAQRQRLLDNLSKVSPKVVVALGNEARKALLGSHPYVEGQSLLNIRGSIYESIHGFKVIPTIHPAFVMRQRQYFTMLAFDLMKAKHEINDTPAQPMIPPGVITNPTFEQVMQFIAECHKADYLAVELRRLT